MRKAKSSFSIINPTRISWDDLKSYHEERRRVALGPSSLEYALAAAKLNLSPTDVVRYFARDRGEVSSWFSGYGTPPSDAFYELDQLTHLQRCEVSAFKTWERSVSRHIDTLNLLVPETYQFPRSYYLSTALAIKQAVSLECLIFETNMSAQAFQEDMICPTMRERSSTKIVFA